MIMASSVEAVNVGPSAYPDKNEELEFVWGKKRGLGGKRKEVQFYESFTYDGVEYALNDCVYMHKEGEHPYIGKLIKIWENPDKSRKIKVQWFFQPSEILYHLKEVKVAENEIFLASGEGIGLANVNPLDAIAGKCNVVCISEDNRNPQPSDEEVKMADYVFYRAFDVGKCTILDKMDDKVGGLDVKFVFNRKESEKAGHVLELASDRKDDKSAVECQATREHIALNSNDCLGTSKTGGGSSHLVEKGDNDAESSLVRLDALHGDANDFRVEQESTMKGTPALEEMDKSKMSIVGHKQDTVGAKDACCKIQCGKDDKEYNKPPVNLVEVDEKRKHSKDPGVLDDRPSKRVKINGAVTQLEDNGVNSVQKSTVCRNDKKAMVSDISSEERKRSGDSKPSGEMGKNLKSRKDSAALDIRLSKKAKVDTPEIAVDRDKSDIQMSIRQPVENAAKVLPKAIASADEKTNCSAAKTSSGLDKGLSVKSGEKASKLSNGKLPQLSAATSPKEIERMEGKTFEVTPRPVAESSKWFKALPWDERIQIANDHGTLVLLQNLDPQYTSGEVEDIIWHSCKENCTAQMVQCTTLSSPHSGRALVVFKTREAAERVTKKLGDGCLMVSNQRPLVASFASLPKTQGNTPSFAGHLYVDKLRLQTQRDLKEAVSTSHCSQPNTIEYEMAMEWRLLQSRSERWWNWFYKQQRQDLRKETARLKKK